MATGHLHLSLFDDGKSGSRSRATLAHQIWPINSGPPMKGIFVSYRRKDRPYATSLLVSKLDDCFGKEYVFHDLADIEIGENFLDRIDSALNSCFALVAVIGPDWLKHCKKKLHRANDPVRLEISTALARGILVIPVLCNAKMPDPDDLPEDLREFHFKNALSLRSSDMEADIKKLTDRLEREREEHNAQDSSGETIGFIPVSSEFDARQKPAFSLCEQEQQTSVEFEGDSVILNRNALDPGNLAISGRAHACIDYADDGWTVSDLSSNQATFIEVEGQVAVNDGDWLMFGVGLFQFKAVAAAPPDSHETIPMSQLGEWNHGLQAQFQLRSQDGETLFFEGSQVIVNRDKLGASSPSISRKEHARFNLCADSWYVSNLCSNRATFIQVVDKVALSDGITLVFGRKLFTFHFLYPHGATSA